MQTQASALLLLACCLWPAEAQSESSIWGEPILFNTKAEDLCTMTIRGHGEFTKLRLSCQGSRRSYWCEYMGRPHTCRSYNKNPRHYFTQMMWDLRKLQNACQAPRLIRPQMCRRAPEDSQMVFSSASFSQPWPETTGSTDSKQTGPKTAAVPGRPEPRPTTTKPDPAARRVSTKSVRVPAMVKTTKPGTPTPTPPSVKGNAKKMAQEYCWRSLHGVCAYVIGWFKN